MSSSSMFQGFFRKRKTSNLEAYVNWFNRLSYLVATEICMVRYTLSVPVYECQTPVVMLFTVYAGVSFRFHLHHKQCL